MVPNILVQLSSRSKVSEFRSGLDDAVGIIAIGPESEASWRLEGLDALYLSVTRAERWGSRPIPPHTIGVLHTSPRDRADGYPPRILTGFLLTDDEPDTADYCIPMISEALIKTARMVNDREPGAIRTIGLFEFELSFKGASLSRSADLLARTIKLLRGADDSK
jgi:hypothetical protein